MLTLRSAFLVSLVTSKEFSFSSRGYFKIMDVLPKNTGPFEVGCTDFMTEKTFRPNIVGNNETLERQGAELNGFTKDLEKQKEIPGYFMRFFYPTEKTVADKFERAKWIPKGLYADGFATFLHLPVWAFGRINRWLMGDARIHAYLDAPLSRPCSKSNTSEETPSDVKTKLPVVVFSHGLGANRTCYSSFCADLASKGFFVAAVEHRDKSASATYYIDDNKTEVDVPFRKLIKGEDEFKLRNGQVTQRAIETSMALTIVEALNDENTSEIKNMVDSKFDFKSLQGALDLDKVSVVGHSFGGCTSLKTLAQDKRFRCGVVLDAWMLPLEEGIYGKVEQPVLFINSETFHWKNNIKKITQIMGKDENKKMLTIRGTGHHSQCDIPSIVPSWILNLFKMTAKMDHNDAIEIQRKLITSYLSKYHDIDVRDEEEITPDNEVIIDGTNWEIDDEEKESWYYKS